MAEELNVNAAQEQDANELRKIRVDKLNALQAEILKEGKYWFKVKNDNNELVHYSKDNFENGKQYNGKISHLFFYDGKL